MSAASSSHRRVQQPFAQLYDNHHYHYEETYYFLLGFSLLPVTIICSVYAFPCSIVTHSYTDRTPAPTSFCKCTCFGNSTIVALDAPSTTSKPNLELRPRASKKSCNDCNRQFCLSYSFCKGEKEEKVLTTCFQRDSTKDQVVVLAFIAATVGLLGYAGVRPWVDQWREVWSLYLRNGRASTD